MEACVSIRVFCESCGESYTAEVRSGHGRLEDCPPLIPKCPECGTLSGVGVCVGLAEIEDDSISR